MPGCFAEFRRALSLSFSMSTELGAGALCVLCGSQGGAAGGPAGDVQPDAL